MAKKKAVKEGSIVVDDDFTRFLIESRDSNLRRAEQFGLKFCESSIPADREEALKSKETSTTYAIAHAAYVKFKSGDELPSLEIS